MPDSDKETLLKLVEAGIERNAVRRPPATDVESEGAIPSGTAQAEPEQEPILEQEEEQQPPAEEPKAEAPKAEPPKPPTDVDINRVFDLSETLRKRKSEASAPASDDIGVDVDKIYAQLLEKGPDGVKQVMKDFAEMKEKEFMHKHGPTLAESHARKLIRDLVADKDKGGRGVQDLATMQPIMKEIFKSEPELMDSLDGMELAYWKAKAKYQANLKTSVREQVDKERAQVIEQKQKATFISNSSAKAQAPQPKKEDGNLDPRWASLRDKVKTPKL